MKAVLEFDLNEISDQHEFDMYKQAPQMLEVLQALTGRYMDPGPLGGFKGLVKWDGSDALAKKAMDGLLNDAFLPETERKDILANPDQLADYIANCVASDIEDMFYETLRVFKISIDLCD